MQKSRKNYNTSKKIFVIINIELVKKPNTIMYCNIDSLKTYNINI